jgi:hypothetical protein
MIVQLGELEFHLPPEMVRRVATVSFSISNMALFPYADSDKGMLMLFIEQPSHYLRLPRHHGWDEAHGVASMRDLLDLVGQDRAETHIQEMRQLLGLDTARDYRRMRSGAYTVYRIVDENPQDQRVYILDDGSDEVVYRINGPIDDALFEVLIGGLRPARL